MLCDTAGMHERKPMNPDIDVAIAIRAGMVTDQMLFMQPAAGIVASSVPELQRQETEARAHALVRAAGLVEEGA